MNYPDLACRQTREDISANGDYDMPLLANSLCRLNIIMSQLLVWGRMQSIDFMPLPGNSIQLLHADEKSHGCGADKTTC